jgi:hypothetical protein
VIDETKPIPQRRVQLLQDGEGDIELYIYGKFQCSWSKDRELIHNVDSIVEYAMQLGSERKLAEIKSVLNIKEN